MKGDVRCGAHHGLTSNIAPFPKSAMKGHSGDIRDFEVEVGT
jgi:hypothetical protein